MTEKTNARNKPESMESNVTTTLSSRRKLLMGVSAGVAAGLPALALGHLPLSRLTEQTQKIIDRVHNQGFPDVVVTAHTGQRHRFFDELVRDRLVLINFMSTRGEAEFPITANMAKLVHGFADRIGRDLFALSISYDPEFDTPDRLAEHASHFNAPPGWQFVSAAPEDIVALSYRLYRTEGRPQRRMHADLIHYGNAQVGLWGTLSAEISDLEFAMARISSVFPGQVVAGELRRAGPRRIDEPGLAYSHRNSIRPA